MNSSNTIVEQAVPRHIGLRGSPESTADIPGRKAGEEIHVEVTSDRVRVRAYEIYQARIGALGDAESDWHQAERELNGRTASGSSLEDFVADTAVLEIKTRSEAQRRPETPVRGGL